MNYFTGMASSPVYEFPYSGAPISSLPFLNYNPNSHSYPSQNMISPFDSLYQRQSSSYPMNNISPTSTNWGNNTMVYQVPGNIPLEVILKELGVDVNTLNQSSFNNYYPSEPSPPLDFVFLPPKRRRRRRVICREVTDSESDDDNSGLSRQQRRRNSGSSKDDKSGTRLHSLLSNVWQKAAKPQGGPSRSNSATNLNPSWPSMQNLPIQNPPIQNPSMPIPPIQNPSMQIPPMQNQAQPMPPPNSGSIGNLWNRAANASNPRPSPLSGLLNKTRSVGGNVFQPPSGMQPNQEAVQDYNAARYAVANISQPAPAIGNVWNRAQNAPSYGPPSPANMPWNPMSPGPLPPPQQQSSAVNSAWARMSGASPPPMNPGWNPMPGGSPPPPPQQQPPSMNSVWARMSGAPPMQQSPPPMNPGWNPMFGGQSQQPFYAPGPPVNQPWNQMQQGSPPLPNVPYSYPPMGPPQSAAARSFPPMFSGA